MHRSLEEARAKDLKYRQHFKGNWVIYVLIFIILNIGFVLGLIYGIIPVIAQNSINGAVVKVNGIAIREPENRSIKMDMNSTVLAQVPVSARFNAQKFQMYLPQDKNQTVFMELDIGALNVQNTMAINVTNANTPIMNPEIFQGFSKQILMNETLTLGIKSKPTLKVAGILPVGVTFQKTVELKGFAGLKGINITNPKILDTAMEDGTNMIADAVIPNPSSFTMQIGDLTADIAASGIALGFSVIKNLTLYPGNNPVIIYNHIDPGFLALPIFTGILSQSNVNITLTMNSTIYNGEHVEWLEKPLQETSPYYANLNPA
ncbi:hypothetical protein ABW20_dc0100710 [Dactylellina cionopaga]|nr:hypothetical protein ABW20_dc0100710 [Dactylellina cionopaga]